MNKKMKPIKGLNEDLRHSMRALAFVPVPDDETFNPTKYLNKVYVLEARAEYLVYNRGHLVAVVWSMPYQNERAYLAYVADLNSKKTSQVPAFLNQKLKSLYPMSGRWDRDYWKTLNGANKGVQNYWSKLCDQVENFISDVP